MKHKKIFVCTIITLVLIFCILIFFTDFSNKIIGFSVEETPYSHSAEPLLDVSLSIIPESGKVKAGEILIITVKIVNMGIAEAEDVVIEYYLWDKEKEHQISKSTETVAVQTSFSIVKHMEIPENLDSGDYVINVIVKYDKREAEASSSFIVESKNFGLNYESIVIMIGIVISLCLVYIVYLLKRSKNK